MELKKLFELLFGDSKTIRYNKKIKALTKDIKTSRFKTFYRVFAQDVTCDLALYFYELYKSCSQLQLELRDIKINSKLRNKVLYHFMDEEAVKIIKQLNEYYLFEQSKLTDVKLLSKQTEQNIYELHKKLNHGWYKEVDNCYTLICSVLWFINFDFYSLLKNFNHQFIERSFSFDQRFFKIKASKIIENIKDFLVVAENVISKRNWETAFEVLNEFKPNANIQLETWIRILKKLKSVLSSTILEMIIRHAGDELEWENKIVIPCEKIAQNFLTTVTKNAHQTMQDILSAEKERNINIITSFIFGSNKASHGAQFYVDAWNDIHKSTGTPGFKHTAAFNYCIIFIYLFFEKIKAICNICLIYGQWHSVDNMHTLSQALYDFTTTTEKITAYDASLSDLGENSVKLRRLTAHSLSGGAEHTRMLQFVESINDEIFVMIHKMLHNLNYFTVFFSKFENTGDRLEMDISNISVLSGRIDYHGYDVVKIKEKTAAFLKLLDYLGFENPVYMNMVDVSVMGQGGREISNKSLSNLYGVM
jgi:hypothetical protein